MTEILGYVLIALIITKVFISVIIWIRGNRK